MINAHIEIVAAGRAFRIGNKIGAIKIRVGRGKKGCEAGGERVYGSVRKNIRGIARSVHADRDAAETTRIQRGNLGQAGIENFSQERGMTAAIECNLIRDIPIHVHGHGRRTRQKAGKIAADQIRGGHE